ncbi:MAG: RNA polymerase sigma factor [Kiritimatiellia bacterium]
MRNALFRLPGTRYGEKMEITDEALMLRVSRSNDEQAFRELMTRYQQALVNHFYRRGVTQEYEDLAQETFLKIYRARKRYRPGASFKAWMFTIAQRVWIDHLRKSGRRKKREEAYRNEPAPASTLPRRLPHSDMDWALDQLAESHRAVVLHAIFHQRSHADTAGILGIPEGTVKSRLHHGLKQLRKILVEDGNP